MSRSLPFEASHGAVRVRLEPVVRGLVRQLVGEVAALLGDAPNVPDDPLAAAFGAEAVERPEDPALLRLLPDAYAADVDDGEAAREFRRLTDGDLRATKHADAERVLATVEASSFDVETAQSWMRSLNDLRLVLGERLELTADGDSHAMLEELDGLRSPSAEDEAKRALLQVYEHFAMLVELLVDALDVLDPPVLRED